MSRPSGRLTLCCAALAWIVGAALPFTPAAAQERVPASDARYDLVLQSVPLDAALERLLATTRIDMAWDPALVAGRRTSCIAADATAEDLLRCILKDTGVDFIRRSSGTYVLVPHTEEAPVYGRLAGIVVDADTGEPLPRAHVYVQVLQKEAATQGAANDAGMFTFARLKPGRYVVKATYLGYESGMATVVVPPGGRTETSLALQAMPLVVETIVVDGIHWRMPSAGLGASETYREGLEDVPTAGGGSDVLLSLDALMGIRVNDATADVHVQGGETGEHQFRLDGAPVFIPVNTTGFVGPFSPFAVGRLTVHKAGFDAATGSQISGVIEAEHNLSVPGGRYVDVQADPLSLNARVGIETGQDGGRQATLTAAARYGLWDVFSPASLDTLIRNWNTTDPFLVSSFSRGNTPFSQILPNSGDPGLGFFDLHAAGRLRFTPLRSLYASAYWGENRLGSDNLSGGTLAETCLQQDAGPAGAADVGAACRDVYTWQTGIAQARYESVVGTRLLLSFRLRGSLYQLVHEYNLPRDEFTGSDDGNNIRELAAEAHGDYAVGNRQTLSFGAELTNTYSRFVVLGAQRDPIENRSSAWRLAAYAQDELALGTHGTLTLGGRLTYLPAVARVYGEPRASFRVDLPGTPFGGVAFFAGAGLYRQFVNQFDVSSRSPRALQSSTRFWLAVDSTVSPPMAGHLSAELLVKPTPDWTLRLEGYYKRQYQILAIDYAAQAAADGLLGTYQRDFLKSSRGYVRGAAAMLERAFGPSKLRARYEYTMARRRIDDLFGGKLQQAPWTEPNRVELGADLALLPNLVLLGRWRAVWGRTWGFRQAYYDFLGAYYEELQDLVEIGGVSPDAFARIANQIAAYDLTDPDSHRLPAIYQLDLSLAYARRFGETRLQARVDVLNVLGRRNVADWHLYYDPEVYAGEETSGFLSRGDRLLMPRHIAVALRASF